MLKCLFGHKWEISKQEREVEYNLRNTYFQ